MARSARKKILLAKLETNYAVDAVPTGADDSMVTSGLELPEPIGGDVVERNIDRPDFGKSGVTHVAPHVAWEFGIEAAGSGAVDTPPAYAPLLVACQMVETVNAATDVQYTPKNDSSIEDTSLTLYGHWDGHRHSAVGSRGTFGLRLAAGENPMFNFNLMGLYVPPVAIADPVPDFSAFNKPVAITCNNTPTFDYHGESLTLVSLEFTVGNEFAPLILPGECSIKISDRTPTIALTVIEPDLASKNYFEEAVNDAPGALQIVHGVDAGAIIQLDVASAQIRSISKGAHQGTPTLEMELAVLEDDFTITTK